MSVINPFSALRPATGKVADVATHSVERYSREEIKHILATNPVSFLHVINPSETPAHTPNERYLAIKNKLQEFIDGEIFIREAKPCIYVYRQIKNQRHHTGFIGLASVDDYNNNVIKIHEQTLAQREEKLKEYLDVCEFNAEPVCLTYPHNSGLNAILMAKTKEAPVYDYVKHGVSHALWKVDNQEELEKIQLLFKKIPAIYIADGHHRAASSARLAAARKAANPGHTGNESYNFFTAAIFADDELTIFSYNRMVQNLNEHTPELFLNELRKKFPVTLLQGEKEPTHKKLLTLYVDKHWYGIDISALALPENDAVSNLDVSVLSDYILSPLLGITDLRNDKRIAFVPAIKPAKHIEEMVDSGKFAAAFCLFQVSFEELISVANSGKEMPPKSTWIEPKLESGLLIYTF